MADDVAKACLLAAEKRDPHGIDIGANFDDGYGSHAEDDEESPTMVHRIKHSEMFVTPKCKNIDCRTAVTFPCWFCLVCRASLGYFL